MSDERKETSTGIRVIGILGAGQMGGGWRRSRRRPGTT